MPHQMLWRKHCCALHRESTVVHFINPSAYMQPGIVRKSLTVTAPVTQQYVHWFESVNKVSTPGAKAPGSRKLVQAHLCYATRVQQSCVWQPTKPAMTRYFDAAAGRKQERPVGDAPGGSEPCDPSADLMPALLGLGLRNGC